MLEKEERIGLVKCNRVHLRRVVNVDDDDDDDDDNNDHDNNDDSDDDEDDDGHGHKEIIGACSPQEGSKWTTGILSVPKSEKKKKKFE